VTTPFQGWFVIHTLGHATINLYTNLKSLYVHYEDTKGNAKCRNLGGLVWLGVIQGHWQHNHSTEHIRRLPIQL